MNILMCEALPPILVYIPFHRFLDDFRVATQTRGTEPVRPESLGRIEKLVHLGSGTSARDQGLGPGTRVWAQGPLPDVPSLDPSKDQWILVPLSIYR